MDSKKINNVSNVSKTDCVKWKHGKAEPLQLFMKCWRYNLNGSLYHKTVSVYALDMMRKIKEFRFRTEDHSAVETRVDTTNVFLCWHQALVKS